MSASRKLDLDHREESDSLVFVGCRNGFGPIRFDLTTVGPATDVIVSLDRRTCQEVFG
jgi:hypothetical protein